MVFLDDGKHDRAKLRRHAVTAGCGLFLALTVMVMAPGSTARAQTARIPGLATPASRTISVSGEAEVRVVPDQVLISMTAEHRGRDLMATHDENERAIADLVTYATKTLGIDPKHVQTDRTSVEPVYRRCDYDDELAGRCSPLDIAYYSVRKGVQIRLDDLEKYEDLVTSALQKGITFIDDVQFVTTELRRHRDRARELAAQAAEEKARALAATLGMKVGKPLSINAENYSAFYWNGTQRGRGGMMQNVVQQGPSGPSGGSEGALALGQINVSATVRVTFEIE